MECKKCGAELPYNAYGDIKCQFCNAQNYVPIPEKKIGVEEKVEIQKPENIIKTTTPMVEKETQRKGFSKGLILIILIGVIIVGAYVLRPKPKQDVYTPKIYSYYTGEFRWIDPVTLDEAHYYDENVLCYLRVVDYKEGTETIQGQNYKTLTMIREDLDGKRDEIKYIILNYELTKTTCAY